MKWKNSRVPRIFIVFWALLTLYLGWRIGQLHAQTQSIPAIVVVVDESKIKTF